METMVSEQKWLFSTKIDLSVFLGSAILSIILLAFNSSLDGETPDLIWISAILMIDVAHVWATGFRVYFDIDELKRRSFLYLFVPISGYIVGVALYSESALTFWKALALVAVFHFVRQQYGWIKLYRAKANETSEITKWIDIFAIYLATIYPLAFWMSNLPRNFEWFIQNDFIELPLIVERILFPIYVVSLSLYFAKSLYFYFAKGILTIGKDIVLVTTAFCWYLGIVYFNSDYAFTVTNVIIHGVPYFAITYFYAKSQRDNTNPIYRTLTSNIFVFLLTLWMLAYVEELFWNRGVWREKNWLFGESWNLENLKMYFVPLLALPQIVHYVLDGFIWRSDAKSKFKLVGSEL
jgi:hypothetical protein